MQRRRFVKSLIGFTGGLIVYSKLPVKFLSILGRKTIKGKVVSSGRGLKNVIVSDGYNVITTDAEGKFEFLVHQDASSIFVSTPSGYAFKTENSIARQYYKLKNLNFKNQLSFELTKLDKDDTQHQFIIWADPQVKNNNDVEKMMNQSVPDTKKLVDSLGAGSLVHGITVGDIVWDEHKLFADYDRAVEKIGIPFFQCLGNHDMDLNKGDDESSDDTFQDLYGPTYYSFNRGKVHYVVMDNVRYLGKDKDYDGYFVQHQLDWLKKDLSFVSKDKLIILCVHIPVHTGTKNREMLYPLLEGYKVHIMSGHTHYNKNTIRNDIFEHNHGTVCGAWWTGPICADGTPNGYGVYKVNGTDLQWFYQSTGEKAGHQVKIFENNLNTAHKQIIANIWNHDPEWQTEFFVDGVSKGALEQFEGMDPLAYSTMLGPDLPKQRGFSEPKLTDHLFKAIVPVTAKAITIKAKDRFGKIYTATHNIA